MHKVSTDAENYIVLFSIGIILQSFEEAHNGCQNQQIGSSPCASQWYNGLYHLYFL
jgi:hypothetical protein